MDKFGYKVEINNYCEEYEPAQELYGSWSESYSNSFTSIHKSVKDNFPDIVSDLNIQPGEKVYVVWLEYSIGDSFGWADRGRTESIAIFLEYDDAEKLQKELETKTEFEFSVGEDSNRILFQTSYGEILDIYTGTWCGYFERLNNVWIENTCMQE